MKMRDVSFLILGVVLSLALGAFRSDANAQTTAKTVTPSQSTRIVTTPAGKIIHESGTPEMILSGDDLGLKVDGTKDHRVVGTLMARVNGKWEPVEFSSMNVLAK